jgi:hypothetical protein
VARRATTVLQPGSVSLHLSLAGAWTRSTLRRLDSGRSATAVLEPETFDAFGDAMAAILTFYLALSHAREVAIGAPWLDRELMDLEMLDDLHLRATRFRDTLMHFGEKAERPIVLAAAGAVPPDPSGARRPGPRGGVSLSFGFEHGEARLYAPVGKSEQREFARLSWIEIEQSARRIETWTLDLLGRWAVVQRRWAPYVEARGDRLGT